MKKNKKSHYNIGDTVIMKITRYGFLAGEPLTVVDPYKTGKENAIKVSGPNKTGLVPTKYLDDVNSKS